MNKNNNKSEKPQKKVDLKDLKARKEVKGGHVYKGTGHKYWN
jgi:hypothetical protein